jgi:putative endonuclease
LKAHDDRQGLGRRGEDLAAHYLFDNGYEILARNWRCGTGELDLVVRHDDCLAMVEVRTRRGQGLGTPEDSITTAKQARLIALGQAYIQESGWSGDWRIDVVAIEMDRRGRLLRLEHYENAVTG